MKNKIKNRIPNTLGETKYGTGRRSVNSPTTSGFTKSQSAVGEINKKITTSLNNIM